MAVARTHTLADKELCGEPLEIREGMSKVRMKVTEKMAVDEKGLVHGGFIFSLADLSSMLAVNHPNVVLAGANVRFTKPVRVGDDLIAEAKVKERKENRVKVITLVRNQEGNVVFQGEFFCVIPEKHVLEE
ncbi:MAG: PaaI family thioesterase [Aquificota bacterium]|nr:PaaI family thioesterase [Aquificota bacterium]